MTLSKPNNPPKVDDDQSQNAYTLSIQEKEHDPTIQTSEIRTDQISFQNSIQPTQLSPLQIESSDVMKRKEVDGVLPLGKQMKEGR